MMRNTVGTLLIVGLLLGACSGAAPTGAPGGAPAGAPPASSSAQGAAPAASNGATGGEIKLGAVLPLTGAFASSGKYFQQGYQMATDEANAAGGVDVGGRKMQV